MAKTNSTPQAQADTSAEAQAEAREARNVTIEALAEALHVTPKDVRRWLRAQAYAAAEAAGMTKAQAREALPGKGGRYAFTSTEAGALVARYGERKATKGTGAVASLIL